eukprot:s2960_g13.t1
MERSGWLILKMCTTVEGTTPVSPCVDGHAWSTCGRTEETLLSAGAWLDFNQHIHALVLSGRVDEARVLWGSVFEIVHLGVDPAQPVLQSEAMPPLRRMPCCKLPCARCEMARGGFQFPFIGTWTRRAVFAHHGETVSATWDRFHAPHERLDLLAVQMVASGRSVEDFILRHGPFVFGLGWSLTGLLLRFLEDLAAWRWSLARPVQQVRVREYREKYLLFDDADFAYAFSSLEEAKLAGGDFLAAAWAQVRAQEDEKLIPAAAAAVKNPSSSAFFKGPSTKADMPLSKRPAIRLKPNDSQRRSSLSAEFFDLGIRE